MLGFERKCKSWGEREITVFIRTSIPSYPKTTFTAGISRLCEEANSKSFSFQAVVLMVSVLTEDNRWGVAGLSPECSWMNSGVALASLPLGELAFGKAHFEVELVRPQEILWCERTLKLCLITVVTNHM